MTWLATVAHGQDESLREAIKVFSSDKAEAERLLRPIVAREPENRVARYFLGEALYYQKKYRAAIEVHEPLLADELKDPQLAKLLRNPEAPLVLIDNLAMAYGISGQHEQCLRTVEKGIELAPRYPYFYFTQACAYADMGGREDEALASCEQAMRKSMKRLLLDRMLQAARKDDSLAKLTHQNDLKRLIEHYTLPRRTLTQEPPDRVVLALDQERLRVLLRLPGFAHWKNPNEEDPKQALSAKTDHGNIRVTLWIEWVGPGATPQKCREYFFGMLKSAPSYKRFHKQDSTRFEDHESYALVIRDATMPGRPPDWFSRSYNAYYVLGEYCFDLHLSAERPTQATEAKMRAIIDSVSIEPLPPHPTLFLKEEPLARPAAGPVP